VESVVKWIGIGRPIGKGQIGRPIGKGQALWFVVEQHPIFLQKATKGTEMFRGGTNLKPET
jgi:hypothetical protein